jgi:AraC-like DNA-binding protein
VLLPSRVFGSVVPGVDFLRIQKTTQLYHGMKTDYGVSLMVDGRAHSRIDGGSYAQTPGTINLKQPGQIHRDLHRESPCTYQLVSFDAALVESSRLALGNRLHGRLVEVQIDPGDERTGPLRRLHQMILAGTADRFSLDVAVTEAVAAFTSFLGTTERSTRLRPSVRRARDFLLDHIAEKVTLDDLADHARTDKFHLCREFSRELGLPPYAFLTRARIARACILLRSGVPAPDVAVRVGFCDQSQMHRHFVRVVGCTPGTYARERSDRSRRGRRRGAGSGGYRPSGDIDGEGS